MVQGSIAVFFLKVLTLCRLMYLVKGGEGGYGKGRVLFYGSFLVVFAYKESSFLQ